VLPTKWNVLGWLAAVSMALAGQAFLATSILG
jgi:hypothetical protein